MKTERMAAIGLRVALASGAGFGVNYGWDQVWGSAEGNLSSTVEQVEACAQVLGQDAVMSAVIPNACSSELADTYSYDTNHGSEYLLPSAKMMRAQLPYLPDQFTRSNRGINEIGLALSTAIGGILFGYTRRLRLKRNTHSGQLIET